MTGSEYGKDKVRCALEIPLEGQDWRLGQEPGQERMKARAGQGALRVWKRRDLSWEADLTEHDGDHLALGAEGSGGVQNKAQSRSWGYP